MSIASWLDKIRNLRYTFLLAESTRPAWRPGELAQPQLARE